jgi:hypothetical protein
LQSQNRYTLALISHHLRKFEIPKSDVHNIPTK